MIHGNKIARDIKRSFKSDLNSLTKIKNLNEFKTSLNKKLRNPLFMSLLVFNKNNFNSAGFGGGALSFPESTLEQILTVILIKIKREIPSLKKYVELKKSYEELTLQGEYNKSLDIITYIGKSFGYSFWYLEAYFSTLSLLGDQDGFLKLYQSITNLKINEIELRDLDLIFDRTGKKTKVDRITYSLDSLKDGLSKDDTLDSYILDFMHRFNCGEVYNPSKVLTYFWQCNIIDIYNSLLRLLLTKSIDLEKIDNSLILELEYIAPHINDEKLLNLLGKTGHYSEEIKNIYITACDLYIRGEYDEFIKYYECNFSDKLSIFSLYELYINALIDTNKKAEKPSNSVFSQFINHSLKFDDESRQAAKKIYYILNHIDILQVHTLRDEKRVINFERENIERIYTYFEYSSFSENPFNHHKNYPNSISSVVTRADSIVENNLPIPDYRSKKKIGDHYFHEKNFSKAIDIYNKISDAPPHMRDEIHNKIILCYFYNGEIEGACDFICELFFKNDLSIERVDSKKVLDILEDNESPYSITVEITIAVHLIASKLNEHQIISLYLDDYLDSVNLRLPSELEPIDKKHEYLMHNVCNLNVLESLHTIRRIYSSSSERLLDRMKILSKLKYEKFPDIAQEIKFLTTQYSRNLCVKNIGKGKINIDFETLKEIIKVEKHSYIKSMIDAFHAEKENFSFNFLDIKNQKDSQIYITVYELLTAVRDIYTLDGKYGLDYQLNTKIRHNGIVPAIRSIFDSEGILCKSVDGKYADNDLFESECKQLLWEASYNEYQQKIKMLSKHLDMRLSKLKGVYMQIMTNDKTEVERLFKFPITEKDVSSYILFLDKDKTADEYISQALELLKKKTNECLALGRVLLAKGLNEDFANELRELKNALKTIKVGKYKAALSLVSKDLGAKMEEISDWLSFSEVVGEHFKLDVAVVEAQNFVEQIFPDVKQKIIFTDNAEYIFNGKHLDSFVHMFILLFENASKKRQDTNEIRIDIDVTKNAEEENTIKLSISNNCTEVDKHLTNKINQEINTPNYLLNANKENNSGLFKVKKIFEIDFQSKNTIILEVKKNTFTFIAKLNISNLIVEDENA